jgi:hypothetical protein
MLIWSQFHLLLSGSLAMLLVRLIFLIGSGLLDIVFYTDSECYMHYILGN